MADRLLIGLERLREINRFEPNVTNSSQREAGRGATLSAPRFLAFLARPGFLVLLTASALALVITWPVAAHFGDDIYGGPGDATGGVTQYWWWGYALTHGKSIFDNSLQGVPLGSGWEQIPVTVIPAIIFPPLSAAVGPIASYNVLILSSFPLTAWATYLLARRLGMSALSAAFSGLAFAFVPYHTEKAQGHGTQTHMEFVALTLYFLVRWRQEMRHRHLVFAGAMVGLQLWMDYSLTLVLGVALLAYFVVNLAWRPAGRNWRDWLAANAAGAVAVGLVSLPFAPLAVFGAHRPGSGSYGSSLGGALQNVNRSLTELVTYSARLPEYVQPWHNNPLVPAGIKAWEQSRLHGSNWTESSLFLGYTVIALALWGLARNRRLPGTWLALALIVVGVTMAEPPYVHFLGHDIRAPSYYTFKLVGFFRVYARFGILVLLAAALLAGFGFAALQLRLGVGRRQLLLLIPFVLLAVEFNNLPPTHETRILPAPQEYVWLRDQPAGVLMEYPAQSGSPQTQEIQIRQYELYQMVHVHPTFLNESTISGPVAMAAQELEPYYKPGVVEQLRGYGIRYVFVHRADYQKDGWQLPTKVPGLSYIDTINGVDIYTVD